MIVQPIIDAIIEIIRSQFGAFDRGDAAAFDFGVGDFVQDNAWRDLDLSPIVPENARAVCLRLVIRATVIDTPINFRTKGNVNPFNVTRTTCSVANVKNSVDVIVYPDADRVIEYKILLNVFPLINVCVAGWWLR